MTVTGPGVPVNRVVNRAAHHAAEMMNRRRRASFIVVPPSPAAEPPTEPTTTNSIGLEVAHQWTITEASLDDGLVHYELSEGDEVLWSGLGDDRVEGLLQIIMRITEGEDPDAPND